MTTVQISRRAGGFTLVELMVTIVIATILLTIAIPGYQSQIRKSRRTEARTALMDLANREERYFSVNNTYTASQVALGYGTATTFQNVSVGSGYYTVTITATAATTTAQAGYSITATATGTQANDTACATFTVDQTGTQSSAASDNTSSTSTCWR